MPRWDWLLALEEGWVIGWVIHIYKESWRCGAAVEGGVEEVNDEHDGVGGLVVDGIVEFGAIEEEGIALPEFELLIAHGVFDVSGDHVFEFIGLGLHGEAGGAGLEGEQDEVDMIVLDGGGEDALVQEAAGILLLEGRIVFALAQDRLLIDRV